MEKSGTAFDLLDGQQRLTTLTIILAVIRDLLKNNGDTYLEIHNLINEESPRIVFEIPAKGNTSRTTNDYMLENVYRSGGTTPSAIANISTDDNEHILICIRQIRTYFTEKYDVTNYEGLNKLENFVKYLLNQVVIARVSHASAEDAYDIFINLNTRGKDLTDEEIIKAKLLSQVRPERRKDYANDWYHMEQEFREKDERKDKRQKDSDRGLYNFLSHLRVIRRKSATFQQLYRDYDLICKEWHKSPPRGANADLPIGEQVMGYIFNMHEHYKKIIINASHISKKLGVWVALMIYPSQPTYWVPAWLAYYHKFENEFSNTPDTLYRFLRRSEANFYLERLLGKAPKSLVNVVIKFLRIIDQAKEPDAVIGNQKLQITDNVVWKLNEDIKSAVQLYSLLRLELIASGENSLPSGEKFNIEHILPKKPAENSQWRKDFGDGEQGEIVRKYWLNKIANLVILTQNRNAKISNSDFKRKKEIYKDSCMTFANVNQAFLDETVWTPEVLQRRQAKLVEEIARSITNP